ncbi:hypothetical protein KM043_000727 [Ampulex compressa]|nr:hypothetical protein KM043_000727 [Ampulex compressa]
MTSGDWHGDGKGAIRAAVEVKGLGGWQRVLKGLKEWRARASSAAAAFLLECRETTAKEKDLLASRQFHALQGVNQSRPLDNTAVDNLAKATSNRPVLSRWAQWDTRDKRLTRLGIAASASLALAAGRSGLNSRQKTASSN